MGHQLLVAVLGEAKGSKAHAIPEPKFGKAWGITIVQSLTTLAIVGLLRLAPVDNLVASLGGIVFGFTAATLIYAAMLPTTGGKAVVLISLQVLFVLGIACLLASVVFVRDAICV